MGQYYKFLVIDKEGKKTTGYSFAYGNNGMKLMEHSYIGNKYVNACLTYLLKGPHRVAWIGDYSCSGDDYQSREVYNDKADGFSQYYKLCWGDGADALEEVLPDEELIDFDKNKCDYYLVNHSKKCYIDLAEYYKLNKWHEEGDYYDYSEGKEKHYSYDMCINPLPLLTACGNGQGGGDYEGINLSYVGSWALDELELMGTVPEGYTEEEYSFKEDYYL